MRHRIGKSARYLFTVLGSLLMCGEVYAAQQPNFLLVVADDMGWADLGSFGSEIHTPNLDALAAGGLTMTHFRTAPACSPSRAMLLTGVDNHLAGVGTMESIQAPNQMNSRHYAAQLHGDVVTVAEALLDSGYATMMAGKWHLAVAPEQRPDRRGFRRSFTLLQGGASHFSDRLPLHQGNTVDYLEDGSPVELAGDFYSSIAYTDKTIEYLNEVEPDQPFFAYVAYTAPHDPLQVPDAWLDRYRGVYDKGPEVVRSERIARQRQLGLLERGVEPWSPTEYPAWLVIGRPPWGDRSVEERYRDARSMEIYAAMVELLDQQIGRLVRYLDASGRLDNTYIIFLSDNGANAATPLLYPHATREWLLSARNQDETQIGRRGTHSFQGREWATVSNTPFRLYKTTVAEGGVRVPFIVRGPGIASGQRSSAAAHVIDVTPTVLELAGVNSVTSERYAGKLPLQGVSLREAWQGGEVRQDRVLGMELFGARAVVRGHWKAVNIRPPLGSGTWQLYDLAQDPGETTDLGRKHPDVLRTLTSEYGQYAETNGVIHPDPAPMPSSEVLYAGPCSWFCELQFDAIDTYVMLANYLASND